MEFHVLPRQDLQALCKRNGVRANMTNVAMADALAALSTVDGIEEYVKQPAAVSQPARKAVVAEEEDVRREKQGSPLPRGRRVTAKTAVVVNPGKGKDKDAEKGDARPESNREDDAPAGAVGRRGASRSSRHASVVAAPAANAAVKKQGRSPSRAGREPARPDDGVETEDLKREADKEDASVQGAGRRVPTRRARPAPLVASAAQPETKVAAPDEKQGRQPPRGRRVTAKTAVVVNPGEGKDKEAKKGDARQESNREEDAPAVAVGRRGASRSSRHASVVAAPAANAAVKKQGSSPSRVGREPTRPGDGVEREALKGEADNEDAPVQGAGRRGPNRRARPAPLVATAAEPEAKVAAPEEKQADPARPNDIVDEDKKLEANNDAAPAQAVGRRGPSRRARPAQPAAAVKSAVEEELRSSLLRRVAVSIKSSAPISMEAGEKDKNEDLPGNVPALGVGRRGVKRCARPEAVVSAPPEDVPAEENAKIPHGRRGKVKSSEPDVLTGCDEEDQNSLKLENEEEGAPAQGVVQRDPSRRARTARAPATTRKDVTSSTEDRDVPVEAALVRPTRVRKPTLKAAAEAEEKVPGRTTKKPAPMNSTLQKVKQPVPVEAALVRPTRVRKPTMKSAEKAEEKVPRITTKMPAPMNSTLQKGKQPEGLHETVPELASDEACYDLENVEAAVDPQNAEQSEVIIESNLEDEAQMENSEVLTSEDEMLIQKPTMMAAANSTLHKEKQQEEPQEVVPALAFDKACYDLDSDEEAADPQKVMINKDDMLMKVILADEPLVIDEDLMEKSLEEEPPVVDEECVGNSEVMINKDDMLMEVILADEPLVIDEELMEKNLEEEPPVVDDECVGNSAAEEKECNDKSPLEEQQVGVEPCATLTGLEDSPVLGLLSMFAEQTIEMDEIAALHSHKRAGSCKDRLDQGMEENHHSNKEIEMDAAKEIERAPLILRLLRALTSEEPALEGGFTGNADHGREMQSSNSTLQGTEETTTVGAEDGLFNQEKVVAQPKTADEAITLDCSGNISSVIKEKVHNEVTISDEVTRVTLIDNGGIDRAKATLDTEELPQGSAKLDADVAGDNFQTYSVHSNEWKEVDGSKKAEMVNENPLQSVAIINEDAENDNFQNYFVHMDGQKEVVGMEKVEMVMVADKILHSTTTRDADAEGDVKTNSVHFGDQEEIAIAYNLQEVIMNGDVVVEKVQITNELQQNTATMDEEDVADDQLETDFLLAEKQSGDITKCSDHIISALHDDSTKSVSMITITDSIVSREEDVPICKNRSEANTVEPVCKNSSEKNTDGPETLQENMGVEMTKQDADLKKLSLRKLRATLKETLELKKRKREPLATVDENVLKLQQY